MSDQNIGNLTEFDEWNNKRLERNRKKRERRQKAKLENPDYTKEESTKRQERKEKAKLENPEIVKTQSEQRQEQRLKQKAENPEIQKRQLFNDTFDQMFQKYKHTFPNPVSSFLWEKLKKKEIDFLFDKKFFPNGCSLHELYEDRRNHIEELREDPDDPLAGSMIFYIKTLVHRPKDQRKLTEDELYWLYNFEELEKLETSPKKKRPMDSEKKRQQNQDYYAKVKEIQKTQNLNLRFIKADPNKVLSIDEITNDPFLSKNYPIREQHKIDLWKADKNLENLDLWRKQREEYEMEVEKLSIEYKENFLKSV